MSEVRCWGNAASEMENNTGRIVARRRNSLAPSNGLLFVRIRQDVVRCRRTSDRLRYAHPIARKEELNNVFFRLAGEVVLKLAQRFTKHERSICRWPSEAAQNGSEAIGFGEVVQIHAQ